MKNSTIGAYVVELILLKLQLAKHYLYEGKLAKALELFSSLELEPSPSMVKKAVQGLLQKERMVAVIKYCRHFKQKIPAGQILGYARKKLLEGEYGYAMNIFEALGKQPTRDEIWVAISQDEEGQKIDRYIKHGFWNDAARLIQDPRVRINIHNIATHWALHSALKKRALNYLIPGKFEDAARIYAAIKDKGGMEKLFAIMTRIQPKDLPYWDFLRLDDVVRHCQGIKAPIPKAWVQAVADYNFVDRDASQAEKLYALIKSQPPADALRIRAQAHMNARSIDQDIFAARFAELEDVEGMTACAKRAKEGGELEIAVKIMEDIVKLSQEKH